MNCNLFSYLKEQEIICLRIALSANDATVLQAEWLKTAEAIRLRRGEHTAVCKHCKQKPTQASTKKH